MAGTGRLLDVPDPWAPVDFDHLPETLVTAFQERDWPLVRTQLQSVMDGAITDGPFGRELLQLVLGLPQGTESVFDQYRAAVLLDHGAWDSLRHALASLPEKRAELSGIAELVTAPVDRNDWPAIADAYERGVVQVYEYQLRATRGPYRHWGQRVSLLLPDYIWRREDIPLDRHLRFRRLHDTVSLAIGEAHAGRLEVAYALAKESQRLGDDNEPFRIVGTDLTQLIPLALGESRTSDLRLPGFIGGSTGPSPIGCWQLVWDVIPLLPLRDDETLAWAGRSMARIGARMASPRIELQAESWHVANELREGRKGRQTELAGLLVKARRATPGLRCLPLFLAGYADHRYESFETAEELARRSGNLWLQISAMVWMTALDPNARVARRLRRLLDLTGWRRPVLVPPEIAADAALGMTALGERAESVIELAVVANRLNVITEVIKRHLDDSTIAATIRIAAVDALARINTMHAREFLSQLAKRPDDIGRTAARLTTQMQRGETLSERELEVLQLAAEGLTNRQIGERLYLSPHTVARHIVNARLKLGAANRTEAAARVTQHQDTPV